VVESFLKAVRRWISSSRFKHFSSNVKAHAQLSAVGAPALVPAAVAPVAQGASAAHPIASLSGFHASGGNGQASATPPPLRPGAGVLLGPDGNVERCSACGNLGFLICCDICEGAYHLDCAGLDAVPAGTWHCPECSDAGPSRRRAGPQATHNEGPPDKPFRCLASGCQCSFRSLLSQPSSSCAEAAVKVRHQWPEVLFSRERLQSSRVAARGVGVGRVEEEGDAQWHHLAGKSDELDSLFGAGW